MLKPDCALTPMKRGSVLRLITLNGLLNVFLNASLLSLPIITQAAELSVAPVAATIAPIISSAMLRDFFVAVENNQTERVAKLLARGVNPNSVNPEGMPALSVAARSGSYDVLFVLLMHWDIQVNQVNQVNETPLMLAAQFAAHEAVVQLLIRGAQVNQMGWTALHYAAMSGQLDTVMALVKAGAVIDSLSPSDTTPLMMACRHNQPKIAVYLLSQGANPSLRNHQQLTAADFAERANEKQLVAQLRQWQAKSVTSSTQSQDTIVE
jgi:ankyrin repeat protein